MLAHAKTNIYNMNTMKKKCLILLFTPLLFGSLSACSESTHRLTFGTYINQSIKTLTTLTNAELKEKADNNNEVFLLAVYQGSYSEDCLCWTTYQNTIASYMNKYHEYIYLFDAQSQDETVSSLKIEKTNTSTPYFYIFNGIKKLAEYSYNNSKDKDIFSDVEALNKRVHQVVRSPIIHYVDKGFLDENLVKNEQSIVAFIRNGCGDCSYVIPNEIIPYISHNDVKQNIWLYDLQDVYELSKSETTNEEEKGQYQAIKDAYGLSASSNEKFGYQNGVVPTIQYYEKDILKDATVFFNDQISQRDDGSYFVSDSYYSEDRLSNLSYLKGTSITSNLLNMTVDANDIMQTQNNSHYWSQSAAVKYHSPILKAFLDYYLL